MSQGIQTFRTPAAGLRMRQQVASVGQKPMSAQLTRLMVGILVSAIVVVVAVSQFVHWQIIRERGMLEQVQLVELSKQQDQDALVAEHDKLMSKAHVEAVVAARLNLFSADEKRQLHRL